MSPRLSGWVPDLLNFEEMKPYLYFGLPFLAVGIALLAFWGVKFQATTFVGLACLATAGASALGCAFRWFEAREDKEFSSWRH